jgi:hypothetical protein
MTTNLTFSQWLGNTLAKWYQQDNQRLGQLFVNELHAAGKNTIANSLLYTKDDPFYCNEISPECLAFVERMWDWPEG